MLTVAGLVLAVPYGMLADATSRKLVLALGLVGLILRDYFFFSFLYYRQTFPLQIVYLAPLFVAIGGGPIVLSATVLSIVASASREEYRLVIIPGDKDYSVLTALNQSPVFPLPQCRDTTVGNAISACWILSSGSTGPVYSLRRRPTDSFSSLLGHTIYSESTVEINS
jgi:MFS family permease